MELLSKKFKKTTIFFSMLSKGLGDIEPALLVIGGDVAVVFPLDVPCYYKIENCAECWHMGMLLL